MKIVSVGRQNISQDEWENEIRDMLKKKFDGKYDLEVFDRFIKRNIYLTIMVLIIIMVFIFQNHHSIKCIILSPSSSLDDFGPVM